MNGPGSFIPTQTDKRTGTLNRIVRYAYAALGNAAAMRLAGELQAGIELPERDWQALVERVVPRGIL